jgi:TctA family transporter
LRISPNDSLDEPHLGGSIMSFGLYAVGYLFVIAGVAYLAHLLRIPESYIVAGVIIMIGIGIVSAVQNTRQRDPR